MYERVANSNKKLEDIAFVSDQIGVSIANKWGAMTYWFSPKSDPSISANICPNQT